MIARPFVDNMLYPCNCVLLWHKLQFYLAIYYLVPSVVSWVTAEQMITLLLCLFFLRLFPFPTVAKDKEKRDRWIKLMNRIESGTKNKVFNPSKDARVCPTHFINGEPTVQNPDPVLSLGYDSRRKAAIVSPISVKRQKIETMVQSNKCNPKSNAAVFSRSSTAFIASEPIPAPQPLPHEVLRSVLNMLLSLGSDLTKKSRDLYHIIDNLVSNNKTLNEQICDQQNKIKLLEQIITELKLKTDKKCNFYTNLSSVGLFNVLLHDIIQPHVLKRFKESRSPSKRVYKSTPKKLGRSRKFHSKDELLLVLMKLRLGLLNTEIADKFSISVSTRSEIVQCWIRAMSECLSCIVHIPSEESIRLLCMFVLKITVI